MSYASVVRDSTPTTDSLSFTPRAAKQPLYRPAVLRHNSSQSEHFHLHSPSPPLSPAASSSDLKSNWLSGISAAAPWNLGNDNSAGRGTLLPKSQWKPDDETVECSDSSCSTRFGLIDRKHHCRRCGYIFCSTHSSHSIPLWASSLDETTAPNTPRMTPRSSALDIPSLLNSRPSSPSPSLNSSLRRASPPNHSRTTPVAITCRVCDRCAFFNPYPTTTSQITPLYTTSPSSSSSSPPLAFRHPSNSARSPTMSPATSPPFMNPNGVSFRGNSRSRQNSGSSSSDATSTAPSSLEGYISTGSKGLRGVSPATSARGGGGIRVVREEESESEDEEENEYNEAEERERRATFGSVIDNGEFSWQSRFATF